MNSDIVKLFKLILERNVLAFERSRKRSKYHRLREKLCDSKFYHDHSILLKTAKAKADLLEASAKLAAFTKRNRQFRSYAKSKYLTRQKTDASNHIVGISLTIEGERHVFAIKDVEKRLQEAEIEQILLGLPQI